MPQIAELTLPSDRELRVVRRFQAPAARLFDAFTRPAFIRRWLLGPPGWSMPECAVDLRESGSYRYLWRSDLGGAEFGCEGVYREILAPHRLVQTQRMFGTLAGPMAEEVHCTLEFRDQPGGSVMTTTILSPSRQNRDAALATGMIRGMEQSYLRLEAELQEAPRGPASNPVGPAP